eukprot:5562374-Ditylum_brightwellii.AAC.1
MRWKDSRVLQTIITVMVKGTTTAQQWIGQEVQFIDICYYQDGMGTVDKGNQHRALMLPTSSSGTKKDILVLLTFLCSNHLWLELVSSWACSMSYKP